MAKKVFIGVGHGGSDPGAVKYLVEKDVNLTEALACKELLEANGVIVGMSRTKDENDPLTEEIKECNAFDPDFAIDVHNNAGGGDGFEAYYHIGGGVGKTLAQNLEAEIKAIGQNSRGIKTKVNNAGSDYFGFIRETKAPAVIVEGVFVDNANDVKIADTVEKQKAFGYAYARGILKTLGITEKKVEDVTPTTVKKSIEEIAREVIRGDWGNGSERKSKLEKAGYSYSAVQARVDEILTGKKTVTNKKTVDELAREVIAGKWGNGTARKNALTKAGYDYNAVQKRVNALLKR